jgi:hypothetical protein
MRVSAWVLVSLRWQLVSTGRRTSWCLCCTRSFQRGQKDFRKYTYNALSRPKSSGGGSRIRTHGALSSSLVFKTSVINHSTMPPNWWRGEGFEPPPRVCTTPLYQTELPLRIKLADRGGLEPPHTSRREPVFETGAIPFRSSVHNKTEGRGFEPREALKDPHSASNRRSTPLTTCSPELGGARRDRTDPGPHGPPPGFQPGRPPLGAALLT